MVNGLSRKISQLNPGVTPLTGSELVPLVQNGETRYVPASALAAGVAIADNLTTNSGAQALSASMGVLLKQLIDDLAGKIHNPVTINPAVAGILSIDSNQVLSMAKAGGSQSGYLGNDDFNLFSGKVGGAQNVGTNPQSLGLFIDKQGADLRFKKIRAGSNVTLSEDVDGIVINSTGGSGSGITLADARAGITETITGIDYNNLTGVFSLTSGYVIPTVADFNAKLTKLPAITGATHPVITYNADGLVTAGRALGVGDIPDLPQSKITNLVSTLAGKLGTSLAAGSLLVGNASNVATPVQLSKHATINAAGELTLTTVGEASQYFRVTTDAYGRVIAGQGSLMAENIPVLPLTNLNPAGAQEGWVVTSKLGVPTWAPPTGGDGAQSDGRRIYEVWQQAESGLAEGNAVRHDPALPGWVKAAADTPDNAARAIGIVTDVNSQSVEVTYFGIIDISSVPLSGNTGNTRYYLPTSTGLAGILTTTAPTTNGSIRKEMLLTLPGGLAFFRPWEHVVVGSSGSVGNVTLSGDVTGSGSGTIETLLKDGVVTANKLAPDSVIAAKIAPGAVTGAKIAQAGATLGQALVWTANGWAPGTVNSGPGTSFTADMSLSLTGTSLTLDGDQLTPGNSKYYGTGPTGIKGYHSFPSSSGIGDYVKLNDTSPGDAAITGVFEAPQIIAGNTLSIRGTGGAGNIAVENLSADRTYLLRGTANATEQIAFMSDLVAINPGGTVFTAARSISLAGGLLTLANDLANPGNNMVYGTSGTGVRGWYPAGTGGGSNINTASVGTAGNAPAWTGTGPFTLNIPNAATSGVTLGGVSNAKVQSWDAKFTLPAGGTKYQFIDGTGALAPFTTNTFIYKPGAATSGTQFATWAEVWAAFQATTGQVRIFLDDSVAACTIPATNTTYDFQNRVEFVSATYKDATLTGAQQAGPWPVLRNAMHFNRVAVQDLILSATNEEGRFRFISGGFQRTYFQQAANIFVVNGFANFTHRAAAVPTFPGVFVELQGRGQVGYTGDSDVATNPIQVLASDGTYYQGLSRKLWQTEVQSRFPGSVVDLAAEARYTAVQPIPGLNAADFTVQEYLKWLYDNRLTGGSFTAQQSVSLTAGVLTLVNDQANPGANKVYGTDANGLRTWRDAPAGGGGDLLNSSNIWQGDNTFNNEVVFNVAPSFPNGVTTSALLLLNDPPVLEIRAAATAYTALGFLATTQRNINFPDKDGTLATLDDIMSGGGGGGLALVTVNTFADIGSTPAAKQWIEVLADETQSGAYSIYLDRITGLRRITTSAFVTRPGITPPAPTGGTVNDSANTFTFTPATGYAATDHERRWRPKGGVFTAWAACTSNTIAVGEIDIDPGDLEVRVSAAAGRNAGPVLTNATAFTGVAFREPFANASGTGQDISTVNWTILFNHPTTGSGQTAPTPNTYLVPTTGQGSGVPVNAGYSTESTSGLVSFSASRDTMFAFTTKFTASRASQQPQRARFYLGNGRTTAQAQIALRIGTSWYVYEQKFNNATAVASAADFAAQAILCETVFASGANWRTLSTSTLNPGASLVSLPGTGDVTGIGVYMKDTASSSTPLRFDCVELVMG